MVEVSFRLQPASFEQPKSFPHCWLNVCKSVHVKTYVAQKYISGVASEPRVAENSDRSNGAATTCRTRDTDQSDVIRL